MNHSSVQAGLPDKRPVPGSFFIKQNQAIHPSMAIRFFTQGNRQWVILSPNFG
jgi:hypothetical protein